MSLSKIDQSNVISWTGRSARTRRAPVTYWQEFIETDLWYLNELIADVPVDEMHAAIEDSDLSDDDGELGDELELEYEDSDESESELSDEEDEGEEEDDEEVSD